jgi:hypothetical protein
LILTVDFITLQSEFAAATRTRGVVAAVARRLNLSHEHVRQVAYGNRKSDRVTKALLSELKRKYRTLRERAA